MYSRASGPKRAAPKPRPATTWDSVPITFGIEYAAILAGVSKITIMRWAREGTVPANKVGKRWRFNKADFMRFVGVIGLDDNHK